MKKRIKKIVDNFIEINNRTELKILPGQLAFNFTLIIIPLLAIFALIASKLINNFDLTVFLESNLPSGVANILSSFVINNPSSNIIIFLFAIIFLASRGFVSIIYASNMFYGIKDRDIVRTTIKSLLMLFIILFLMTFLIIIPLLGNIIFNLVINKIGLSITIISSLKSFYKIIELVLSVLIIFLCIDAIYVVAPDKHISNRTTSLGAFLAAIGWIIVTSVYSFYIANFAHYNQIYSNVANIVMLLIWIYSLSYVFVLGMIINFNKYGLRKGDK